MHAKTINLQTKLPLRLKNNAEQAAKEMGFSNLQEAVRIFLKNLASRQVEPVFVSTFDDSDFFPGLDVEKLDSEVQNIDKSNLFVAKSSKEALNYLESDE